MSRRWGPWKKNEDESSSSGSRGGLPVGYGLHSITCLGLKSIKIIFSNIERVLK